MRIAKYVSRIFFPRKCTHCGNIIPFSDDFCYRCSLRECAIPEGFCFHCNKRKCHCDEAQRRLRHITAPFIYTGGAKRIIFRLKFRKMKYCAPLLCEGVAREVIENFSDADFDFVTFVPMSNGSKKRRGYNQSEVIARLVAKKLFIPCSEVLVKTKDTPKQHFLDRESRQKNLADAIFLREGADLKGKTVLLCDDIKTTGSTLFVCEDVLISAGVKDVYCAVAAIPVFGNNPVSIDKKNKKT